MYGRHDRAKMDILVTSRNRAVPCTEWSKTTNRTAPIIGSGGTTNSGIPLDVQHVERHRPCVAFQKQLPREPVRGTSASHVDDDFRYNMDAVSTHPRSTVCGIDMRRSKGRNGGDQLGSVSPSPVKGDTSASVSAASPSPPESPKPKRKQRIYMKYSYDAGLATVRPASRCVNMANMLGRKHKTQQDTKRVPDLNYSASSKWKRAVGGDFSKAQGRCLDVKKVQTEHDIKWAGVDKHVKGVRFTANKRPVSSSWYLDHGPIAPLCTRWNGVNLQAWHDQAHQAVKSRPPSVAAPRSIGMETDSVIRSAGAQLNMIRNTLQRHTKEGERKKKERLTTYQADSRISNRELSPVFAMSYQTPAATAP